MTSGSTGPIQRIRMELQETIKTAKKSLSFVCIISGDNVTQLVFVRLSLGVTEKSCNVFFRKRFLAIPSIAGQKAEGTEGHRKYFAILSMASWASW